MKKTLFIMVLVLASSVGCMKHDRTTYPLNQTFPEDDPSQTPCYELRDIMCERAQYCDGDDSSVYREHDKCIKTWNETWCSLTKCSIDERLFAVCKAELQADPSCTLEDGALFTKTCWKIFDSMTCDDPDQT